MATTQSSATQNESGDANGPSTTTSLSVDEMQSRLAKLETANAAMLDALRAWQKHDYYCNAEITPQNEACLCGFDQARDAIKAATA